MVPGEGHPEPSGCERRAGGCFVDPQRLAAGLPDELLVSGAASHPGRVG